MPFSKIIHRFYIDGVLGGALILVMAVTFLEHLMEWRNPQETLLFAIAIAVVAAILIALGKNEKPS
jgi:uncharacterized membrane protein YqhA